MNRPTGAILAMLQTVSAARGVVGIPEDDAAFLRDLGAVLDYLREVEQSRANAAFEADPCDVLAGSILNETTPAPESVQ